MISQLNQKEHDWIYQILAQKYGRFCVLCRKTIDEISELQLHEMKYVRPLDPENFCFLCLSCNKTKSLSKSAILGTQLTATMKKNIEKEPLFRNWLYGEITKPENNFHLPLDRTIDQAAFEIGVSTETIKRYLRVLCDHPTSPYVTQASEHGVFAIWVKGKEPKED